MAQPLRRERVTELVHHELGDIIQREVRDPRLGWVTVTRVEMSPDLRYARVFVSVLGGDEQAHRHSLTVLERAGAFIRTELGRRIRLRMTPELQFKLDHSLEHSQRIMDLLREIGAEGRPGAHAPEVEGGGDDSAGRAEADEAGGGGIREDGAGPGGSEAP